MSNRLFSGPHPHTRKISIIFLLCALLIVLLAPVGPVEAERTSVLSSKIDTELAQKLVVADPNKTFDVVLKLKPLAAARPGLNPVASLKSSTAASQSRVLSAINKAKAEGHVKEYRKFWIANAIVLKADADTIKSLASRPDVKQVIPNFRVYPIDTAPSKSGTRGGGFKQMALPVNEWNLSKVGAPDVWSDFSVSGDGTVVAVIDTGIDGRHPDLTGKIDQFVRIDFLGNAAEAFPRDWYGHGTHVAGTIAGGNAGGTAIGVAPAARLMGVQVFTGNWGTYAQMLGGIQWAADPDGNPLTNDQPDAANMSFGIYGNLPQFFEPIDNLRAAGVYPAVSIGNAGPGISGTPGNVPSAVGVGATDVNDVVAYFSSGEDTTWYDAPYAGVWRKPDISAPGVDVNSSVLGAGYDSWDGTSMASPHIAGAAALVKSSQPGLTIDQIDTILQSTAVDLGARGKDIRYGNGRVDVRAAVELAQSFAVITGDVTAGGKAATALIEILAEPGGTVDALAYAGGDGKYSVALPAGSYSVRVTKYGFTGTTSVLGPIAAGDSAAVSFALSVATKYTLSGRVKDASTGKSLSGKVEMLSPATSKVNTNAGKYSFSVPSGQYVFRVTAAGYTRKDVTIDVSGANKIQDIPMSKVKSTLLVIDVGALPYAEFFKTSLAAAGVPYDTLVLDLDDPDMSFADAELLAPYRRVIWAAGDDISTGTLPTWDEEEDEPVPPALISYLAGAGKLFITGQEIGEVYDFKAETRRAMGIMEHESQYDFMSYIKAKLVKGKANNLSLSGRPKSIFQGVSLDLLSMGADDGANNQYFPDVIAPTALTTVPELNYTQDLTGNAALRGYTPENGRFVYFGFGFEGIDNATARNSSMTKVVGWLDAPPASLAFWPSYASVTGGSRVALSGKLKGIGSGEKIRVEQMDLSFFDEEEEGDYEEGRFSLKGPEIPGIWKQIGTANTGADGSWRLNVLPSKSTIYRAVWDGNGQKARTVSQMNFISVSPLIYAWRTAKGSIPAGGATKIEGSIKPVPADDMVTLFRRDQGENEWDEVKSVGVARNGRFSFTVNPSVNSFYRVGFEETDELGEGLSRQVPVSTRHKLTLSAEDNLAPSGVKIYFGGKIYPAHPGHTIKLQRLENGKWKTMKSVKLGSGGNWSTSFLTKKKGRFSFRVVKERDAKHFWGASNIVSVRFY